jgi:Protein of unknown function (DUF3489)
VVADHQNSERQGGMSRSFPLSGMKEPVCPAVPPDLIIPCSSAPKLSNNIIQKGLVFARGWSRTVANSGRTNRAPRSCPAGLVAEVGLRWCGVTPSSTERRISCPSLQRSDHISQHRRERLPQSRRRWQSPIPPRLKKGEPGSKQSRVIAMLQSPAGATIAAMMKATGWQQHSVRGFLAGVVRKRLKLKLGSKKVDGIRGYQIAGDDGVKSGPHRFRHRPA